MNETSDETIDAGPSTGAEQAVEATGTEVLSLQEVASRTAAERFVDRLSTMRGLDLQDAEVMRRAYRE